jgi:inhibitor of KinA
VIEEGAPANDVAGWLGERVKDALLKAKHNKGASEGRTVELPVCYGGEFGPDLATVAEHAKLSPEEVIKRHCAGNYLVYLVGFSPGFAYLGGLAKELATPRHATPRPRVPAGSIGIGGEQTGVYPVSTPGGWNLIGRTPLRLFLPEQDPPVMLRAGDRVKFRAISMEEFVTMEDRP